MRIKIEPEHVKIMDAIMDDIPDAKAGKMFGSPAYKTNGKLAVAAFDGGIVVKVGAARTKELVGKRGIAAFEPLPGRVWKDWVLITGDFEQNRAIFAEAVQYVLSQAR
ncbi:MAG: hypothetical protein H7175_12185 [Burkholderiales bacterium]|nr:hypothetical protein [Anaerolineae bacterium]